MYSTVRTSLSIDHIYFHKVHVNTTQYNIYERGNFLLYTIVYCLIKITKNTERHSSFSSVTLDYIVKIVYFNIQITDVYL